MDFEHSPRTRELLERLDAFIEREVAPREEPYHRELLGSSNPWIVHPAIQELKGKASAEGLWNLFLPGSPRWAGTHRVRGSPTSSTRPWPSAWAVR